MYRRHTYYSDMVDQRTCVYRFYDSSDRLLYVGLTMNPEGRFAKHRRRAWWPVVVRAEIEWHGGREAAKSAERSALMTERPIHNIAYPKGART